MHSSSLMDAGTGFLLKPIFIHGFSASLHLVLLLVLFVSWVCGKLKVRVGHDSNEESKERVKNRRVSWYKKTLVCCLGVSAFNFVLCLLSYFYWYRNDWSDDKLVTLFDLVLRTLGWGAISVYLHTQFFNSGKKRFPFLLRVWWGFYMSISCYCLVIHIVLYNKQVSVPIQYVVSDVVSVITGLFFCYVGFLGKHEGEDAILLQEPLLDGNTASEDVVSPIKPKGSDKVTPYSNASLISILTFSWMGTLIADGNKKTLDLEDVPQLDSRDSVVGAFPTFRNKLEAECGTGSGVTSLALVKALFFFFWKDMLSTAFLALAYTSATYVGPFLIDTFVQYLSGKQDFEHEGYVLVSAFFVAKLVECLSRRHWVFRLQRVGVRVRAVIIAMVYNKGLTLSCQAMQGHTSGEIINFMTVDAERLGDFIWYIHDPWLAIVQVGLAFLILYKNLGLASVATVFAAIIVMLVNFPFWRMQEKFQEKLMESKDKRLKATSEILRNMRILKLQGWEMKFLSKIIELRKSEAGWLKKQLFCTAMANFIFWNASSFLSVTTFGACMILGIPLSSGKILSAIATFRILQGPMDALPDTISMIIQTRVSLDRIASFLRLDDLQSDVVERQQRGCSDTALEIIDGNFSWDLTSPNQTLKDINLKVFHGMNVAVCGTVGSGKSSLLSCILGEIPKISGILRLCGTKAYVAQSPWIQSGTIQENILFGKEMDREVLLTLLCSKTVIYVTHQVEFLPAADLILVMKDGKITQAGKYSDILNSGTDFMELVGAHKQALSTIDSMEGGLVSEKNSEEGGGPSSTSRDVMKEENKDVQNDKSDEVAESKGQLVQEEEREKGKVGFSVYWKYITTVYGGALVPFILLSQVVFQTFQIGSNYWIAWASPVSEEMKPPVAGSTLIIVYVILAIGSSFCLLSRNILLVTTGYKTASLLFNKMHMFIFRAPMSFFDATPSGRILNRASTDQSAVDMECSHANRGFCLWNYPASSNHYCDVSGRLAGFYSLYTSDFYLHMQYYIPSARELSRLVGVCKAPVIQHFAETISGSTTIRSFDQESRFQNTNMKLMDGYSRPKFHVAGAMEWLCFRIDVLSSITFACSLVLLISVPDGVINAEGSRPDPSWPSHGEVGINDLQVRYAPALATCVARFNMHFFGRDENWHFGQIMIDGVNISSIGLHDLRSRLSIIPQDPTMFEGTVRSNLDPLDEYTDEQIWEALDKCQLGDEVRKKEGKLDSRVTENGENWSMGQRQLVCLGRVLLKKSKVLVLDEATASVDTATDNLIQQTLRQHFSDSTVITIAHRITSVLDSDMVLLLNQGLIEEYDSPTKLLENKSSSFAQLVAEYSLRSNSSFEN
ncbi:hypothetical protein Pint_03904 [Pistacia integerrima]|uniref:Uncharacterized protein n=1 Tax=Pistacia integerrima TaxID=434235 RepID=A0ACC0Z6Y7_9ROSI|nr:hypothetical protein Pint_03904 [Pistacia integerrima]